MKRRGILTSTVGMLATNRGLADEKPLLRKSILGTWSLTEAVTVTGNETSTWFGRQNPISGLIMYGDGGHMSVQISGSRPGIIGWADYDSLHSEQKFGWLKEYYAYYGTFEVDEATKIVTHHVTDSLFPFERSASLRRKCELQGDTLTLLTEPRGAEGRTSYNRLLWKKLV